jgi:hypothetical protein
MRRLLVVLGLSTALACTETADGPDLTGVWRITSHSENTAGCTPGAAVTDPPYIQFTKETLFGQEFYQWAACTSPTTCDEPNGLFGLAYAKAIDNGWEAQIYIASGNMANCSLGATVSTAVVGGDGGLTIETRAHEKTDVSGLMCDADEAKAAFDNSELTCASFEVMTAVRQ